MAARFHALPAGLLPGLLALLPALSGCGPESAPNPTARRSVILVSLDTLRADRLGCYGYGRPTSPFLDELAAQGVLFEAAMAPSSKTATSHMSMFTGMHPGVHGVRNYYGAEGRAANPGLPLLPELFQNAGYTTAAFTGGGMMSRELGFGRGFATYDDGGGGAPRVFGKAESWLRQNVAELRDEPFFLFVHTYEIHDPYTPPQEWQDRFATGYQGPIDSTRIEYPENYQELWKETPEYYEEIQRRFWGHFDGNRAEDVKHMSDLYDAGIAFTDDRLRQFWAVVGELGLADEVVLVVTSDHGEEFADHRGMSHQTVYQEILHVPLIVRLPDAERAGATVPRPVQGADLAPSLAELCDLALPVPVQGRSFAPSLRGELSDWDVTWSEVGTPKNESAAMRWGRYKLIGYVDGRDGEFYDLELDPREKFNMKENLVELAVHVTKLMFAQKDENDELNQRYGSAAVSMGEDAVNQMKALGYTLSSEE